MVHVSSGGYVRLAKLQKGEVRGDRSYESYQIFERRFFEAQAATPKTDRPTGDGVFVTEFAFQPEHVVELLSLAANIENDSTRAVALWNLCAHISSEHHGALIEAAKSIQTERERARVFGHLVPYLLSFHIDVLIAATKEMVDPVARMEPLTVICAKRRPYVWERADGGESNVSDAQRAEATTELLRAATSANDAKAVAHALIRISDSISAEVRDEVIAIAIRHLDELERASVLESLSPYLSTSQQQIVLTHIKAFASEELRARIVRALHSYLSGEQLTAALSIAEDIEDEGRRVYVLADLARRLDGDLYKRAFEAALAVQDEGQREHAKKLFSALRPESKRSIAGFPTELLWLEAPAGLEADIARNPTDLLIEQLLNVENVPPAVRAVSEAKIREVLTNAKREVQLPSSGQVKSPVPVLTKKQVAALIAFGRKHPYATRDNSDRRTPFEWVRDEYRRWYPGILMHHLKQADEGLWSILHKRRSRAKTTQYSLPDWFDVPTQEENEYRAATPEERIGIDAVRKFHRDAKRQARLG